MPINTAPATAAVLYTGLEPRNGIDTTRPTHNNTLRITAEPMPAVASAKPASAFFTPELVMRRKPSALLAALPAGKMLPSARVLS